MKSDATMWVVIANGARARVFEVVRGRKRLRLVESLECCEGARRTREQGSDKPGRTFARTGTVRHAMEPGITWQRLAKKRFAAAIAGKLNAASIGRGDLALVLVAPPRTLGYLRDAMTTHARARIREEVTKDLTRMPETKIEAQLRRALEA